MERWAERHPHLRRVARERPEKTRRHDADDCDDGIVESNAASDDRLIASERALPHAMAD
jgi:hypothetical protein